MEKRRDALRKTLHENGIDAMLVTSGANRLYVTGFTGTAGLVLITENESFFFTDFRYVQQAADQVSGYEIVEIEGAAALPSVAKKIDPSIKKVGFEADHVSYSEYERMKEHFSTDLVPIRGVLEQLRMIKDDTEMDAIRRAVQIVDDTYSHLLEHVQPGMREIDVATELEFDMRRRGASGSSFDIIVASGKRSALPHGVASEKRIEKGDMVTVDFGAYVDGYASDMTRTFAVGEPSSEMKRVYDVVLQAQEHGVKHICSGMTGKDADALCRDIIDEHGYGEYFGHATGHGLGLDVHEQPRLSKKSDTVLQAGMVVTIEPGVYIPQLGGVRIEDDVWINEESREILTQSSKQLIVVE